jgi:hypothetical protein
MSNRMVFAGLCACSSAFLLPAVGAYGQAPQEFYTAPTQEICTGKSANYTLNIAAKDGSNTLTGVSTTADPPIFPAVNYDNASKTVSGLSKVPGNATITVSGSVQTNSGNVPFKVTLPVIVVECVAITVCTGKDFDLTLTNTVATANVATVTPAGIATAAIAPAAAPASHVVIHGVKAGTATVTLSTPLPQGDVGKVTVTVKDCPVPKTSKAPPPKPPANAAKASPVPGILENAVGIGIGVGLGLGLSHGDDK